MAKSREKEILEINSGKYFETDKISEKVHDLSRKFSDKDREIKDAESLLNKLEKEKLELSNEIDKLEREKEGVLKSIETCLGDIKYKLRFPTHFQGIREISIYARNLNQAKIIANKILERHTYKEKIVWRENKNIFSENPEKEYHFKISDYNHASLKVITE